MNIDTKFDRMLIQRMLACDMPDDISEELIPKIDKRIKKLDMMRKGRDNVLAGLNPGNGCQQAMNSFLRRLKGAYLSHDETSETSAEFMDSVEQGLIADNTDLRYRLAVFTLRNLVCESPTTERYGVPELLVVRTLWGATYVADDLLVPREKDTGIIPDTGVFTDTDGKSMRTTSYVFITDRLYTHPFDTAPCVQDIFLVPLLGDGDQLRCKYKLTEKDRRFLKDEDSHQQIGPRSTTYFHIEELKLERESDEYTAGVYRHVYMRDDVFKRLKVGRLRRIERRRDREHK